MTLDLDALEKIALEAKSRGDESFGLDDYGDLLIGAGAVLALITEVRNRWKLIENYTREYPRECNKRVKAEAERDALQAKLDRVKALHVRDAVFRDYCAECSDFGNDQFPPGQFIDWPCPTIQAIGETGE